MQFVYMKTNSEELFYSETTLISLKLSPLNEKNEILYWPPKTLVEERCHWMIAL